MSGPDQGAAEAAGIADRYRAIAERVARAAERAGRSDADVTLLVATKTQPPGAIRAAVAAGARLIGENRVEEVIAKADALADLAVERHFIGHLQRNKVPKLAGHVSCVESVDSLELALHLSRRWAAPLPGASPAELGVFVQVNVSGEVSKYGCAPERACELAADVAALPHLRLAGLMTIASLTDDVSQLAREYGRMRALREELQASGAPGTARAGGLSMGMTHDFEIAVAEGATEVRVGTAVFGPRG